MLATAIPQNFDSWLEPRALRPYRGHYREISCFKELP